MQLVSRGVYPAVAAVDNVAAPSPRSTCTLREWADAYGSHKSVLLSMFQSNGHSRIPVVRVAEHSGVHVHLEGRGAVAEGVGKKDGPRKIKSHRKKKIAQENKMDPGTNKITQENKIAQENIK